MEQLKQHGFDAMMFHDDDAVPDIDNKYSAQELYARVIKLVEHFEGIRDGLLAANKAYDAAVGSFERMVRPSGERLLKLGGGTQVKELPDIQPLPLTLREPPRP